MCSTHAERNACFASDVRFAGGAESIGIFQLFLQNPLQFQFIYDIIHFVCRAWHGDRVLRNDVKEHQIYENEVHEHERRNPSELREVHHSVRLRRSCGNHVHQGRRAES